PSEDENEFYNKLTALPFPPDLQPGMSLDGYKVIRELHATNHIQLYLATDPSNGDEVVLKTPSVNFEDDPTYIDMFVHEEWIGKRIDNAHVMKVCPPTAPRKFLYYVAEFIPGRSLRQWMNDNPSPTLSDVRRIIGQIARGLRAFHRLEMIHQDLKPENIMLDEHGTIKIIDFGSTKIAGIAEIKSPIDHDTLVGTEDFIAPEYHRNEPASNKCDIFSLGVIAYQMLTGKLPYGKPLNKRRADTGLYVPIAEFNTEVPDWMDAAIRKAVHLQTAKRYELLSEFTHDISNPNSTLLDSEQPPLLERNPVSFWKTLSLLLFLLNLFLLYSLSAA
ncbi:MAG: serine/threonine protein kinase, partial [Gammaproteobacteria bacterium]|nr:serine/threonine protein kinase [Gammaproteobacteria bacterium]